MTHKEQANAAISHARDIVDGFGTIDSAGVLKFAQIHALLALEAAVSELTAEAYRTRVALEVLAGEALDRELCRTRHPAGSGLEDDDGETDPDLRVVDDEAESPAEGGPTAEDPDP